MKKSPGHYSRPTSTETLTTEAHKSNRGSETQTYESYRASVHAVPSSNPQTGAAPFGSVSRSQFKYESRM